MPQRTATIESLPAAFEVVRAMQANGLGRGLSAAWPAVARRDHRDRDCSGGRSPSRGPRGRGRCRSAQRLLPAIALTELGDIKLSVPRPRSYCPTEVVRAYARRSPEIDRTILAGFVLGLSTRKLGEALLCLLGWPVSPAR